MPTCLNCGRSIFLTSVQERGYTFCSEQCCKAFPLAEWAQIPPAAVAQRAAELQIGPCPKCGSAGPLDFHKSHRVWSAVVLTFWQSRSAFSCRQCARDEQLSSVGWCLLLGWWGFPFGLILTPIQILRNLIAMSRPVNLPPSPELISAARRELADRQHRRLVPPPLPMSLPLPLPVPSGNLPLATLAPEPTAAAPTSPAT